LEVVVARPKDEDERADMIDQAEALLAQAERLLIDAGARRAPKLMKHFRKVVRLEKNRPPLPEGNVEANRRPLHVNREQE
jgi:hypothetical protein